LRAAADSDQPEDAALDAVAVSSLLRSVEADPAAIGAELHRPVFPTSRVLYGRAMVAVLERRRRSASCSPRPRSR
jgi:hypothetical protein